MVPSAQQVFIQNGISISSAVFAHLTVECPITLQLAATFPPKLSHPLGGSGPNVTYGTYGLPESSSQTASRSVQPLLYGFQMLCCTMHCQRGKTKSPLPWDFVIPPENDRATAIGNMQKTFGKDRACGSRDMFADRQTHRPTHRRAHYFATAPVAIML